MKKDYKIKDVLNINTGLALVPKSIPSQYAFQIGLFKKAVEKVIEDFREFQTTLQEEFCIKDKEDKYLWNEEFGAELKELLEAEVELNIPVIKLSYFKDKDVNPDMFTLLAELIEDDTVDTTTKGTNAELANQSPKIKFTPRKKPVVEIPITTTNEN